MPFSWRYNSPLNILNLSSYTIAGMDNAKRILQEIVILPALRPEVMLASFSKSCT